MAKLADGAQEILTEIAADASAWLDESTADESDIRADIMAEFYAELDAMRDNQRRLEAHEAANLAAMVRTPAMQAELWGQPPY